ncbi:MAG: FIST N-terminal domain-containing protein [Myxococcota bacterium]
MVSSPRADAVTADRVLVLHSNDPDTEEAVLELLAAADEQLAGASPVAIVVFAGIDADHEHLVAALADRFGDVPLVGCTTDGEMSSAQSFQEDSIALMLFVGDGIVARAAVARDLADPVAAAQQLLADAAFPGAPKVCLALPESLDVDALALVEALGAALPPGVALVGGTAGDQWRFHRTRQLCGREVFDHTMPILLLGGDIEVGVGVASGWTPLGRVGKVTRAEGPVVHEVDGQPAMAFYREYHGHHVEPNPEFPTLVLEGDDDQGYLRAPFRYDADTGAVIYTAAVPEGAGIQVTTAPTSDILQACRHSVAQATAGAGRAFAAIAVSCAARKQILGTRTREECTILRDALGDDVPVIGFYSYGEIAPLAGRSRADFHNETFVTLVLRSAER